MTRAQWQRGRTTWERFGATEPYWSVLSHPQYRATALDAAGREAFFASGEADVARTLDEIRRTVAPDFQPQAALDFGCGVGRLAIPLARRCARVVGLDVSAPMLQEARANCDRLGVPQVELAIAGPPGDTLARVQGEFDLVYSYIVFQHIAPAAGLRIVADLLRRLRPGGVGALHFTFAWDAPLPRRLAHRLRRGLPLANMAANLLQRRPLRQPAMPMYQYDLARLHALLWAHGCRAVHARLEEHVGHLGAMLLFRPGD
ncbi:MAG TPA: class I SAM-dependent methyltransferase [Gemmatimonadaceae bacterium]|nr:class I SAM-dependent methyltransferase [Gemmatimonadaceae bacterium]